MKCIISTVYYKIINHCNKKKLKHENYALFILVSFEQQAKIQPSKLFYQHRIIHSH